VFLYRLVYPSRLEVIANRFGRSPSWCSSVSNDVAVHLWKTFRGLLEWHPLLNYNRVALYAEAISELLESRDGNETPEYVAGEESAVFWGFVDGAFRGFCRPAGYEQERAADSGHKRDTGQKFKAIFTPDGLVMSLIGPGPR
jgi:hypothetical protein